MTAGLAASVYASIVRPWHLRWGATCTEAARALPGDELVSRPQLEATRAITIAAPREGVWPWLVQMGGYTRAGWYSYDFFDNAGRPSALQIRPELQHLAVGDVLPFDPDGSGFEVRAIHAPHCLVTAHERPGGAISVTYILEPLAGERTRLLVRLRLRVSTWRGWPFLAAMDVGDFVFMRRMLLGIRERAERGRIAAGTLVPSARPVPLRPGAGPHSVRI